MEQLNFIEKIFAFLVTFGTGVVSFWGWIKFRKTKEKKDLLEQLNTVLDEISKMSEQMLKDKLNLAESKTKEIQYKTAIVRIKNVCAKCSEDVDSVLKDLKL